MYLTDFHMHSRCSPDGSFSMTDMALAAAKAGLSEICFTDHCDLMDLNGAFTPEFDWAPLEEEFLSLKRPKNLKVRFGVELGEAQEDTKTAEAILAGTRLDFVIGSIHNMGSEAGGEDFYFMNYRSPEQCYHCLDDYFRQMMKLTRWGGFDVLGHVPYPMRYMQRRDGQPVSLKNYWDQLEEIFRHLAHNGRGIEVNTDRGRNVEQWKPILQLYKDCGGEIITVGADAHVPEHVSLGIEEAYYMMDRTGFRYVATYEDRKPVFWKLDETR